MGIYPIANYPWPGDYRPRAEASLEMDDQGLAVRMSCWEKTIIAKEWRTGGDVYKDSCLEFFFMPCPETDPRYINCEVNCIGTMHIGVGEQREGRTVLTELPEGIRPQVQIQAGECWSVQYRVPHAWIKSLFPEYHPRPGMVLRGNFYCIDESIHPHFGCWHPVVAAQPDFHRPECFEKLVF